MLQRHSTRQEFVGGFQYISLPSLYSIHQVFINGLIEPNIYTEQQKKRIFCIFGLVYKLGF